MPSIRPMGTMAFLIDYAEHQQPLADVLVALERTRSLEHVIDAVPAAQSLLIRFSTPAATHRAALEKVLVTPVDTETGDHTSRQIEIPVRYDGADLESLAAVLDMTPRDLVAWHTAAPWTAAFGGFAPGFSYLVRDAAAAEGVGAEVGELAADVSGAVPKSLDVPRLASPRTRVPAGAVGLAGTFSGIYPIDSPGGWRLIGSTDVELWDVGRTPPALLTPGTKVQFVEVARG